MTSRSVRGVVTMGVVFSIPIPILITITSSTTTTTNNNNSGIKSYLEA